MSRAVLITFVCSFAFAEEMPPPIPPPPLESAPQPLPPQYAPQPPRWFPYAVPGPSPNEILALEAHGRHVQKVGGVLMATGGAVAAVGMGLWIAGTIDQEQCNGFISGSDAHSHCGFSGTSSGLTIGGAVTNIAGTALFVSGIIVHLQGGDDVKRARALKHQYWRPISVAPHVGPHGGGLSLTFQH